MKGTKLHECKDCCGKLSQLCHNTKNRSLEIMCDCDKNQCKTLKDFTQCLMTVESLCQYIGVCCCEQENLSKSIIDELSTKCMKLSAICDKIISSMKKDKCDYLNCDEIKKLCKQAKSMKSKSKSKKK